MNERNQRFRSTKMLSSNHPPMEFDGKNNSAKGWLFPLKNKKSVSGPRLQFTKTNPETQRAMSFSRCKVRNYAREGNQYGFSEEPPKKQGS